MAVLVLAALYNPRQVIYVFLLIPVPIWAFVIFYVASDAFSLLGKRDNGVAVSAHLGGAAFGFAYYTLHWRLMDWLPSLSNWPCGAGRRNRASACTARTRSRPRPPCRLP